MEKKTDVKNIKQNVKTQMPQSEVSGEKETVFEDVLEGFKFPEDAIRDAASETAEYTAASRRQEAEAKDRLQAEDRIASEDKPSDASKSETDDKPPPVHKKQVRLQAVSDRARNDIREDALNFAPTVRGLVSFLKSEETKPPLAIAVNGRWGQGKTSYMQMVDSMLQNDKFIDQFRSRKIRFATTWFNPWKFSEADKVWASFVDVMTRCIRDNLGFFPRIKFSLLRLFLNIVKRFDFGVAIRLLVLFAFGYFIFWFITDDNMANVSNSVLQGLLTNEYNAHSDAVEAVLKLPYKNLLQLLGALVIVYQLYFKVVQKLNLGLLEYIKETDFRDKIGTLAEFDTEMKKLNACIPRNLKIVIFIDDLDRCKPDVLLEIIQALQLLHVSERCIFILGLDLQIVSSSIEEGIPELSKSVGLVDGKFQHGSGYQFLEKIIHTRINVPYYSSDEIGAFISNAIGKQPKKTVAMNSGPQTSGTTAEIFEDSPEVKRVIQDYGKKYLYNPRRIKKFINTLRLYVHLSEVLGKKDSIETIARFLIIAEKWPGVVDMLRTHPDYLDQFLDDGDIKVTDPDSTDEETFLNELKSVLTDSEIKSLLDRDPPINSKVLTSLCDWVGFQFYKKVDLSP